MPSTRSAKPSRTNPSPFAPRIERRAIVLAPQWRTPPIVASPARPSRSARNGARGASARSAARPCRRAAASHSPSPPPPAPSARSRCRAGRRRLRTDLRERPHDALLGGDHLVAEAGRARRRAPSRAFRRRQRRPVRCHPRRELREPIVGAQALARLILRLADQGFAVPVLAALEPAERTFGLVHHAPCAACRRSRARRSA